MEELILPLVILGIGIGAIGMAAWKILKSIRKVQKFALDSLKKVNKGIQKV
jgi:hypothetical protein